MRWQPTTRVVALAMSALAAVSGCGVESSAAPERPDEATNPSVVASGPASEMIAPTTSAAPAPSSTVPASATTSEYDFPIVPADAATYGRSHHDYPAADIFAPCGSDVVAPHAGTVQDVSNDDTWSSSTDTAETRGGLSLSIVGDDGVRYYGSHLRELDPVVQPGIQVIAGQRLGTVGDTGNAVGSGCHLHFGISVPCGPGDVLRRRGEFWPQEFLDAWKRSEPISPTSVVAGTTC